MKKKTLKTGPVKYLIALALTLLLGAVVSGCQPGGGPGVGINPPDSSKQCVTYGLHGRQNGQIYINLMCPKGRGQSCKFEIYSSDSILLNVYPRYVWIPGQEYQELYFETTASEPGGRFNIYYRVDDGPQQKIDMTVDVPCT